MSNNARARRPIGHLESHSRKMGRTIAATTLLASTTVLPGGDVRAATFEVQNLDDSGPGSLRDAISLANASAGPDTIVFKSGLVGTIDVASEMSVAGDLIIDGSTSGGVPILDADGNSRLFTGSGGSLTVRSLELHNGQTTFAGGAVFRDEGRVELIDTVITGSSAGSVSNAASGGGVSAAEVVLTRSTISGSSAFGNGGAISADTVTLVDSEVLSNSAQKAGGGIQAGVVTLMSSRVSGNTACVGAVSDGRGGGGIDVGSTLVVDASSISENDCVSFDGGGIHHTGAVATIGNNSTVTSNSAQRGGGIHTVGDGTLTIASSSMNDNEALYAGALFADGKAVTITDATANGNEAERGGALELQDSTLLLEDSTLDDNTATTQSGGAIFARPSATTIRRSSITNNTARTGGAIFVEEESVTIEESTVTGNRSTAVGAGLTALYADVTITGGTWSDNEAADDGGAVYQAAGSLSITDVTLNDNVAGATGGAIAAQNSTVTIAASSFARNGAELGGAIHLQLGIVDVTGSDWLENTASSGGGAMYLDRSAATVNAGSWVGNDGGSNAGALGANESQVSLSGATLSGNSARTGGAIALGNMSTLSVDGGALRNNAATEQGGAINSVQSTVTINDADVTENSADEGGAASTDTNLTVTDSTLTNNTAVGDGGAILMANPADGGITLRLTDVTLSENSSTTGDGGAVASRFADVMITRGSVVSNEAAGRGGGIDGREIELIDVALRNNAAGESGGAVNARAIDVDGVEMSGNRSGRRGGGLSASTSLTALNSTFSANTATDAGGAINVNGGFASISFTTVIDNEAGTSGGGIHFGEVIGSIDHVIAHGNDAPSSPDLLAFPGPTWSFIGDLGDATPSVDGDGRPLDGLRVGIDPMLEPLADNGGPTRTHLPMPRSPIIDGGRSGLITPDVDQRDVQRPTLDRVDVGAVEYDGPTPVWIPVTPARMVDTRTAGSTIDGRFQGGGLLLGGVTLQIDIAGRGGVPDNATAAIINVAAVRPVGTGFLTIYGCEGDLPNASSVNFTGGVNMANEVIAGLSSSGTVCVFASETVHLTVDVVGFVDSTSPLTSIEPSRLLDTRDTGVTIDGRFRGQGRRAAGEELELEVGGRAGIPADAAAVVANVIAVGPGATGFVTTHACEDERPLASSLNYVNGVSRGNEVVAGLDDDGKLCIFTAADTHLVVDVVAYLPSGADLSSVAPSRIFETRAGTPTVDGESQAVGRLAGGTTSRVQVTGRAGVSVDAETVNLNITAVNAATGGFLTVFPCGARPLAASLNFVPGVNGGNDLVTGLDVDGGVCVFNEVDTDLTIDVAGFTTL